MRGSCTSTPSACCGALPGGTAAPALEAPTLHPTAQTMGELPTTDHSRTPWSRWAIPLVLAAIVAAAAIYEWMRPAGESPAVAQKDVAPAPVTPAPSAPAAAPPTQNRRGDVAAQSARVQRAGQPKARRLPNADSASTAPRRSGRSPPPAATAGATDSCAGRCALRRRTNRDHRVSQIFLDRDTRPRQALLLTGTQPAGTTQTVSGAPPLSVTIGNAGDVTLRYKGEPIDLAPFTQKNVARLRLQ